MCHSAVALLLLSPHNWDSSITIKSHGYQNAWDFQQLLASKSIQERLRGSELGTGERVAHIGRRYVCHLSLPTCPSSHLCI